MSSAAPTLHIRLLGELDLRHGEAPLPPLESARAASLLAYVLLHREAPQPRQHLAFLLWPDSTEPQARTNLRHVLHTLRHGLPNLDQFMEITPRTLQWRPDAPFWLDVAAFEAAVIAAAQESGDGGIVRLREAVEMYTGDLLEGSYDEWILGERERLRQHYLEALERLATLLESLGKYTEAIRYAERLLRHDPLHEETYRLLMRLHDARGDRARALRVYHVCAATLERELGIEPSAPTREAYEALLPAQPEPLAEAGPAGGVGGPPFIGRVAEGTRLRTLWRATETGGVHFVLVTGEPGIGKTRLIEEFRLWCVHQGAVSAVARSYAAEGVLAYAPVVEWLRSESLKARLERLDPARLTELARLLPERLPQGASPALSDSLPESDQRQRLFDAAAQAILAAGGSLLLVADDLHWWDQESLQFLHYLLRVQPQARLLVAATARREAIDPQHPLNDLRAGLHALGRFTEIDLGRLAREDTAILAQRVTGRPLEEPDADQLYEETEGNPLFVVEAMRAGWARGAEKGRTSPKVQSVIEARLGQLTEPARNLVGVAATIGRAFTSEVLAGASEADENALVQSLDELWRRRIIREQGTDAYDFSHDKIREVAYLALSPARRRHCHLRVAQALERLYVLNVDPVSGQIAAHYERAARGDEAIAWYERAAEAAQQLHANLEAVRLLDRGLNLLRALPAGPGSQARELAILTALPAPMVAVEGYQSSRVTQVHQRALDLTRVLEVEPEAPLLRSLATASLSRGDFDKAHGFALRLRARGERDDDDVLLVEADYVLGIAAFWSGQFEAACKHFEAAVERYRPEHRRAHLLQYGQDPKVVCLSRLGNTLWFLGRFDAARQARDAALDLAEEVGHPYSHWVALVFAAMLALEFGDVEKFRVYTATAKAVWGDPATHNQISVESFNGYIDVLDGHEAEGIARIQRALEDARGAQSVPGIVGNLVRLLLAACETAGAAQAGLAAAERALTTGGSARAWEAEAHRLRGVFLAKMGGTAQEVESELERALEVARRQGAPALVLRAAMSLVRHRAEHGDGPGATEARQRLAAIFEALPEGRDTPDSREAAALLAQT